MDHCIGHDVVFFPSKHGDSEQEISFLHWRMRLGTSVTEYHDYPRPMASIENVHPLIRHSLPGAAVRAEPHHCIPMHWCMVCEPFHLKKKGM